MIKDLYFQQIFKKSILAVLFFCILTIKTEAQSIGVTAPAVSTIYCAGASVNVTFTISGTFSNVPSANVFTAQLSDVSGSFATSPVTIGTRTNITAGTIACTIPFTTATSSLYRIRVISSNPVINGSDNGANLTVNALAITSPTITNTTFCYGETFSVAYSQNCNFSNSPTNNVYTVQLSDASGSFASPTAIGTRTANTAATITATVPSVPGGTGYRVRIVASNPAVNSPDNGTNLTINASAGNPSVFGTTGWNAYCFNAFNNFTTNYQGFYTENNLSFSTTNRWVNTNSPSVADASSGSAYAGCPFGNTNYSVTYKRTNIPCGYYQIDMPGHDDYVYFLLNGVMQFQHVGCCDAHTNIWTGFIDPSQTLEFRFTNGSGPGNLAVNIFTVTSISMSAPVTICAGSSTTLTATNTNTLPVNYSWAPAAFSTPSSGTSTTVANPTVTTVYTVTATDAGTTTCSYNNTVTVTVNPLPTTTVASTTGTICNGISTATLTSGGAASYTWSPASGLNTVSGATVIANPTVTTTYTVSGSNNCAIVTATTTVVAQLQPSSPSTSTFGNGTWNVFCYYNTNNITTAYYTDYYGYYTENNLTFDSRNRWATSLSPSNANSASGLAYQGCTIGVDYHSTISKRTNFPCAYYQIDIPYHDDNVTLYVNGIQVFQHNGCCDAHTAVWTGFLGASSTVEVRQQDGTGTSGLAVSFSTITYPILSPPASICAGTSSTLTASPFISGATYSWSPGATLSATSGTLTVASPTSTTNYTCTVTDPVTTCSASASVMITVSPLPTTTVSPTSATVLCSSNSYTLTAGGANTYSWSPSSGLSTTSGNTVVASPSVTTVYTVTGSNNCSDVNATTTITVVPLIDPTVFGNGTWNSYCYGDQVLSSYYGYYKENGSGASGYDFNTSTKWVSGGAPSTANATNGAAYIGCTMSTTNFSMSFKRTNFACNTYTINVLNNDDGMVLLVNGAQVATRATSATTSALWSGVLNTNSTVEFRLVQSTSGSGLSVAFVPASATASLSTWIGTTSTDWFTASNWCGSGIPIISTNVLIPNAGPQFMPTINGVGAACKSLTISAATASNSISSALPAASLTIAGSNNLDVYGNWINNGSFTSGNSTVNLLGSASRTISCNSTQTFYNVLANTTGAITITSGVHVIGNNMDFTSGIVTQNATLQFSNGATVSNANNGSYVNGQVVKYGTQSFTFPVGASNLYRPVSISAPSVATDNFTAKYFYADASPSYTHTSKDATIDHISRCEYWILNRTGGTSNVNVTLTWNTNSCGVTNLSDLIVARWDAGQVKWKDHGNGGTTGNTTAGSVITSAPVTLFSPFTLASKTSNNPLPVELITFNCHLMSRNQVELSWSTASEINNDYFDLERSLDGVHFDVIGKLKGAGNSTALLNYSFVDVNSVLGIAYYRLKQMDYNSHYKYSPICSVTNSGTNGGIVFYPNPVNQFLTVDFNSTETKSYDALMVTDITGKEVMVSVNPLDSKLQLDCSLLENGIYFLKVFSGNRQTVNKFTVQR